MRAEQTPQQHDDSHDAAPPTGIAAPEQNKEQINPYARAGPTIHRPYVQRLENGGLLPLLVNPPTPVDYGFVAEKFYPIEMGATAPAD